MHGRFASLTANSQVMAHGMYLSYIAPYISVVHASKVLEARMKVARREKQC
jgi:hypothetical protein